MKYLGFLLLNIVTLVQLVSCLSNNRKWVSTGFKNVTNHFLQEVTTMSLFDQGKWVAPCLNSKYLRFPVPGGSCPRVWEKKWGDIFFASQHKILLNYWWKWPGSMINIKLKSEYRTDSEKKYLRVVESALEEGLEKILGKFVSLDSIDRKQKETYMKAIKSKLTGVKS